MKQKKRVFRVIAMVLAMVFIFPLNALASEKPSIDIKGSHYLISYSAYTYAAGKGKIQVWFDVIGTREMADLGALSIKIYESTDYDHWTWVKTFTNKDTPDILGHNTSTFNSHVDYQGVAGRYYKAQICIWGGLDNEHGDTRYFWTSIEKAT